MAEIKVEEVRAFLKEIEGQEISLDKLRSELGIEKYNGGVITKSFNAIRGMVYDLVEQRLLRYVGRGLYKVVKQVSPVQVFGVEREDRPPFDLKFPRAFDSMIEMDFANDIVIREGDLILISGMSNFGKALRNGTPILTPSGWLPINKLTVGDIVFDSLGKPTKVLGVYPQNLRQCFRFTFSDGTFIDSDSEHLWQIQTGYSRRSKVTGRGKPNLQWHQWSTLSTKEIIKLCGGIGEVPLHQRFIIPGNEPVQFDKQEVALDPYLVGLLLGDGGLTGATPRISTADTEIIEYIRGLGIIANQVNQYDYRLLCIYTQLGNLKLRGTHSDTKFIPPEYLFNDIATRLAVLQGLMDTDGYIHANSQSIEYSTCSKQLAEDVLFLVRSLGGRCRIYNYDSHYIKQGQRINGKTKYRVNIKIVNLNPFRLKRKADRYKGFAKTSCKVIRRIDYVNRHHTTCIKVDSPTGLFIAKDFIVTHNTTVCLNYCGENIKKNPIIMGNEYTIVTDNGYDVSPRFIHRMKTMSIKNNGWIDWVDSEGKDKFTLLPVWADYAEHIIKNKINIIDWINLPGEYYMISPVMEGIKKALGRGVGIVALQKNEGNATGRGGSMTRDFADLEMLIDRFGDDEVLLTLGKVKESTRPLAGKTYAYTIHQGVKILNFREVKKCPDCSGQGFKVGKACETCGTKKFIDK